MLVLNEDFYKNLIARLPPPPSDLSDFENSFLDILLNKQITAEQRLAAYQNLFAVRMNDLIHSSVEGESERKNDSSNANLNSKKDETSFDFNSPSSPFNRKLNITNASGSEGRPKRRISPMTFKGPSHTSTPKEKILDTQDFYRLFKRQNEKSEQSKKSESSGDSHDTLITPPPNFFLKPPLVRGASLLDSFTVPEAFITASNSSGSSNSFSNPGKTSGKAAKINKKKKVRNAQSLPYDKSGLDDPSSSETEAGGEEVVGRTRASKPSVQSGKNLFNCADCINCKSWISFEQSNRK